MCIRDRLEAVGGKVPATINGKFPEKYFNKKAVVEAVSYTHLDVYKRQVIRQSSFHIYALISIFTAF